MPNNIEDSVFEQSLPTNSIPVLDRIKQLLKENETNSIKTATLKDFRMRKCVWLLLAQIVSPVGTVDMREAWQVLENEKEEKNGSNNFT